MKQLASGISAPDFELPTINGQSFRLSEATSGGQVALVFYKASCPTCQFTFPYLQRIYEESRPRLIAVSQDDANETREFADRFGITFDVVLDEHPYDVSTAYGVEFVPAVFMIGTDGIIQLSDYGFSKEALSKIAGREVFRSDDGIPARRPG